MQTQQIISAVSNVRLDYVLIGGVPSFKKAEESPKAFRERVLEERAAK